MDSKLSVSISSIQAKSLQTDKSQGTKYTTQNKDKITVEITVYAMQSRLHKNRNTRIIWERHYVIRVVQ